MDTKPHNGYTNYATWCVCLWWNNDQALHERLREIARNPNADDHEKSDQLQEMTEDWCFDYGTKEADLSTDLLSSALADVNWLEIIETNKED